MDEKISDNQDDFEDDFERSKNMSSGDFEEDEDLENLDDYLDEDESSDDEDDLLQDEDALEDDPWEKQVRKNKHRKSRKEDLW